MKIKIRYENEYQTLEVENVELERWLNISISEDESQEDYEKRIQDVIEERFNRPDYNSWHKHDRHTGNAYEALTNIHREEMAADKKAAYLPLVYVCSPYAGDVETNVKNARAYSRFAVDENAIPVTPHLLYPQFMDDGNEAEREMAMHFNYVLLGKCTEVWVFGGVISRGMAREIGVAKKRRMKIRWFTQDLKEVGEYD